MKTSWLIVTQVGSLGAFPQRGKFGDVADLENCFKKIGNEAVPVTTKRTTGTWISVFEDYLKDQDLEIDFSTMSSCCTSLWYVEAVLRGSSDFRLQTSDI